MDKESAPKKDTALSLLRPPGWVVVAEDLRHSWSSHRFPPFEEPFLRIWDCRSGSIPDNEDRMRSRAPRQRLDTQKARQKSLEIHINQGIWEPTAYVSFTTSPAAIEALANWRANRRGSQTLTVVDPNTRIADMLPILDVRAEMDHYEVKDSYGNSNQYYTNHFLCLWEVTGRDYWSLEMG